MRFAVVADTHVRPDDLPPGDFPANALLEARNRHMVDVLNRLAPAFVIHLGDVVHPVPGDVHHHRANELASVAYARLDAPLYVVPGNHDVGDKPFPWVDAPTASEEHYVRFEARWGPRHRSFRAEGCRFVLVDTPVLGTGTPAEADQWRWLEATLADAAEAGERIFLFGHYPPYLWDPTEAEHYDNLAPPVRRRLLDLVERYDVEAVFSGHVHRFFHRRHGGTDLYVVPAVGFVRPGYAEFDAVAPVDEFGRDDRAKLGLFVVEVGADGHIVHPVRTWGRAGTDVGGPVVVPAPSGCETRIGVTLRHGWASPRDLVMGGLDEFGRKRARDDASVFALWEARIRRVRIPVDDLERADTRERVFELAGRGTEFTVVVPGVERLKGVPGSGAVARWEVVLPPGAVWDGRTPRPPSGTLAVAPLVPVEGPSFRGAHFVSSGFSVVDSVETVAASAGFADEAVFRVRPPDPIWESVAAAVDVAAGCGLAAVVCVELPRRGEGSMFGDEAELANRVVEAEIVARANPGVAVFLDGFVDHDRGYFPRLGLVDRRGDPRAGLRALAAMASCASGTWRLVEVADGVRTFEGGGCRVALVGTAQRVEADAGWVSLVDGRRAFGVLGRGPWLASED